MIYKRRFHIVFAFHYLRYGLVLCLVPMVRALLAFDLASLWTALTQDAAILAACLAAALILWSKTAFCVHDGCVYVTQGVIFRSEHTFSRANIAVVEIARPVYCRLLGASRVTLFFKTNASRKTYSLYLSKKDAAATADELLPVRRDSSLFAPTGFERLALMMVSANILTSFLFAWWGVRQLDKVLGQNLEQIAINTFHEAELFAARWLPMGLAFFVTFAFAVTGITLLHALFKTAGFTVCRNGGVLISKGGLWEHTERRVLVSCISCCDVRITPAARILRRYPVYLSAGSFRGSDLPVLVYKKGQENTIQMLLRGFTVPEGELCSPKRKSPAQYLWRPGACFAFSLALCGVASYVMPTVLPMLAVPVLLSMLSLFISAEGFFREGLYKNSNRTLSVCCSRWFTRHEICVFTPDLAYTLTENPFSVSRGRCDVKIHLPCRICWRVRGVLQYLAREIPFTL